MYRQMVCFAVADTARESAISSVRLMSGASSHDTLNTKFLFMYRLLNNKSYHLHYYSFIIRFSTSTLNVVPATEVTRTRINTDMLVFLCI